MKLRLLVAVLLLAVLPAVASARWIKDKFIFHTKAAGPVVFSHNLHLDALGNNCPTCHNGIFNIVATKNPAFTMADMDQGKACGACHNGDRAFSVKKECATCHPIHDVTFKVPDMGNVTFSHKFHTSMFGCKECHPKRFIPGPGNKHFTMDEMGKGKACGGCHNGNMAFSVNDNCGKCHKM